jgi:hypothetical protein
MSVLSEVFRTDKRIRKYQYFLLTSVISMYLGFGMAIAKFSTSISDRSLSVRMSDVNVEYLKDRKY